LTFILFSINLTLKIIKSKYIYTTEWLQKHCRNMSLQDGNITKMLQNITMYILIFLMCVSVPIQHRKIAETLHWNIVILRGSCKIFLQCYCKLTAIKTKLNNNYTVQLNYYRMQSEADTIYCCKYGFSIRILHLQIERTAHS